MSKQIISELRNSHHRMKRYRSIGLTLLATTLLSACFASDKHIKDSRALSHSNKVTDLARFEPEPATQEQSSSGKTAFGKSYVAVTANPHATEAAEYVLERGGSAIDAAIAAQMVLGLVEPQSSGLGGGGFLVYWDAESQQLSSFDGRETAPAAADENLFFDPDTQTPLSFFNAVVGGRSVGVPGLVRMLGDAHKQGGKLPWAELIQPAIKLAKAGFVVSPRLNQLITRVPAVDARAEIADYLFDGGEPLDSGVILRNPNYAQTLEQLAQHGPDYFYTALAKNIVDTVSSDANPGKLSVDDFSAYQVPHRTAVCKDIFSRRVCGMAPPSAGPTTVLSILGMMEVLSSEFDLASIGSVAEDAKLSHFFIEASRLAFADRNAYIADPDFVDVPIQSLLASDYLASRAASISDDSILDSVVPGVIPSLVQRPAIASIELESTTHLSIVDSYGNALSMTTSIETAFGSRLMSNGFILNNQLTDFSFAPREADGDAIANRVEGGKRPVSSMSPMIVFSDKGTPELIIGSPGGKSIIPYVARVLYEVLALGRDLQTSIDDSHIVHTGKRLVLEKGFTVDTLTALQQLGHEATLREQSSGIHAIQYVDDRWLGVADKRREGIAAAR